MFINFILFYGALADVVAPQTPSPTTTSTDVPQSTTTSTDVPQSHDFSDIGYDCVMLPGEGEPSEKGKGADFTRGGFCPLNDRCREDDPDCIPELGYGKPTIVHWGDSYNDKLDRPVDLHFHPEKPCELWVLNQGDWRFQQRWFIHSLL
jgi:hypothetical protein